MCIWNVLVLNFSYFLLIRFMPKVYISQFFSPKLSSICFIFHLMNTQLFVSIALLYLVANIIYVNSLGKNYAKQHV